MDNKSLKIKKSASQANFKAFIQKDPFENLGDWSIEKTSVDTTSMMIPGPRGTVIPNPHYRPPANTQSVSPQSTSNANATTLIGPGLSQNQQQVWQQMNNPSLPRGPLASQLFDTLMKNYLDPTRISPKDTRARDLQQAATSIDNAYDGIKIPQNVVNDAIKRGLSPAYFYDYVSGNAQNANAQNAMNYYTGIGYSPEEAKRLVQHQDAQANFGNRKNDPSLTMAQFLTEQPTTSYTQAETWLQKHKDAQFGYPAQGAGNTTNPPATNTQAAQGAGNTTTPATNTQAAQSANGAIGTTGATGAQGLAKNNGASGYANPINDPYAEKNAQGGWVDSIYGTNHPVDMVKKMMDNGMSQAQAVKEVQALPQEEKDLALIKSYEDKYYGTGYFNPQDLTPEKMQKELQAAKAYFGPNWLTPA